MTTVGEVLLDVRGDVSRLGSDIERGTSPGKMGKLGGVAGKALAVGFSAAAGAVVAGGAFLKGAFDEADEARKVGALTASTIKATGKSANVSADQVGNLAGRISEMSGIDDEAIQSGANLLLTFRNVRNEMGKGNQVFDRATTAATNLSAAGFGSIEGSSKMLGKALNDPLKGISALGRAGVTFSDDQKKMIESMVESGDTLGAQKVILGEVDKQVGGAAKSQATAAMKMGVAWGNLQEQVGTALMPVFDKVATFIGSVLIPAVAASGPAFAKVGGYISPVVGFVQGLFDRVAGGSGQLTALSTTFSSVFGSVKSIVSSVVIIVTTLWNAFGSTLIGTMRRALTNILTIVRGAFMIISGLFQIVASLLRGDWSGMWDGIKKVARGAVQVVLGIARQLWNLLRTAFSVGATVVRAVFSKLWAGVKNLASSAMRGVVSLARTGMTNLVNYVKGTPARILGLAGAFLGAGKSLGSKVIHGIMSGLRAAGGLVSDLASSIKSAINGALRLPFTIKGPGKLPDFSIPAFAKGTNNAPGGMALVGEQGPELVNLPKGSKVATAARTRALAGRVSAGPGASSGGRLRLVSGTLSIDASGEAYIRGIAEEVVDDADEFAGTLGRMG